MMNAESLLKHLPLSSLRPSATNPRKSFDAAALEELADSIREQGLQVPLLVRPELESPITAEERYEVVCGARRLRACQMAGAAEVPCLVREMTDAEVLEVQITENLQRADVHAVEEAAAYAALIEAAADPSDPDVLARDLTVEDVARKVGKRLDYVAKRMKLLHLHELATRLFAEGHITLDHALRLAVLTPKNQVDAMVYLLGIAKWEIKRDKPAEMLIAQRMDSWAEQQTMEYGAGFRGRRLVWPTETELKIWIAGHVLLQLKSAPWRLDDAALLPPAGPCTTCPKRSGSSPALFGDLTAEDDVCLDAECFAAKRKAHVQYLVNEAKVSGGVLLNLSSKPGEEKLPEEGVTEKTLLKKGQWVEAPNLEGGVRSCAAAAPGLLRDGDDAGKVLMVCALQSCKVHKHRVESRRNAASGNAPLTPEQVERQAKHRERIERLIGEETGVRRAVYEAMLAKLPDAGLAVMRRLVMAMIPLAAAYRVARGIELLEEIAAKPGEESYETGGRRMRAAQPVLHQYLCSASMDQLARVALEALVGHEVQASEWQVTNAETQRWRETLWAAARDMGVDAAKVAAKFESAAAKPEKKAAAKKVGAKKVVAKKGLSKAGIARMNEALKKRKAVRA